MSRQRAFRTAVLTVTAMIAFAANSVLCRMALRQDLIDPGSFTSIRILAGVFMLSVLVFIRGGRQRIRPMWSGVVALFVYMAFFSFAYLSLTAGTGALLLFGAVQLTMLIAAIRDGEHLSTLSWLGLSAALGGLVLLLAPGVTAPDPIGAIMMIVAGVAWGIYSLLGRSSVAPLLATTANFLWCVPLAIGLGLLSMPAADVTVQGALLAISSGALASGLGYAVWYAALPRLTGAHAATIQLSVPVIAALGGVLFLSEQITVRLMTASALTLGGIWLVIRQQSRPPPSTSSHRG